MDYFAFGAVHIEYFLTSLKTGWSSTVSFVLLFFFFLNCTGLSDLFTIEIVQ